MFDAFSKEKADFLKKIDKSRKGSIDKDIAKLIGIINSKGDYCTTSSCAGRIVLIEIGKKKNDCEWILAKHSTVKFEEVKKAVSSYKGKNELWIKQQALILHVACRNLESAKEFLNLSRKIFKKAGIIAITENKVTVEVIGSHHLETVVKNKGFQIEGNSLKEIIKTANRNFLENRNKILDFEILVSNRII